MSLFSRHLCAGQTVTIHVRVSPGATCSPLVQTRVRDPRGAIVFEAERQLSALPPPVATELPVERRIAEGLCEAPPLLLVAQHLREDADSRGRLVHLLQDIRHSAHWYWHWPVPDGAALGRYAVDATAWVDGRAHGSGTAPLDQFFVEHLSLASLQRERGRMIARVRNHSPEPARARLHEQHRRAGGVVAGVRAIVLPADTTVEITSEAERAWLVYAEDNGLLWLHAGDDPVYVRDQTCAWTESRDESVLVTSGARQRSFTLKGGAREIWLRADGPTPRAELCAVDGDAFAALLAAGLLRSA